MMEPWTEAEHDAALTAFQKIAHNNDAWLAARRKGDPHPSYPMPHDLYEAHRRTMKSISSEIGLFDEKGRIFLTMRPSADEDPAEPHPSLWHIPGTRHISNETGDEALLRLIEDEVGTDVPASYIGYKEYAIDGRMGLSLLYLARVHAHKIAVNDKRGWFDPHAIPTETLTEHIPIIQHLVAHFSRNPIDASMPR